MRAVAPGPVPLPRQEGDVEAELPDCGDVLVGIAVDQLDPDIAMANAVAVQQFGKEAGGDGGVDADPDAAVLGAAERADVGGAFAEVADDLAAVAQEAPSGEGEADAGVVAMEEGCAEAIFEIADAAADGGFLNADGSPRLAEAAMFSRGNEIPEMTKLDRTKVFRHRPPHAAAFLFVTALNA